MKALRHRNRKDRTMEKMIMIPEERYLKMLESYDKAVEELYQLREVLDELGRPIGFQEKATKDKITMANSTQVSKHVSTQDTIHARLRAERGRGAFVED